MSADINKDRRNDADTSYDKRDIQSYDGDQSRDIGKDRVYDYDNTAEAGAKYGINKDNDNFARAPGSTKTSTSSPNLLLDNGPWSNGQGNSGWPDSSGDKPANTSNLHDWLATL